MNFWNFWHPHSVRCMPLDLEITPVHDPDENEDWELINVKSEQHGLGHMRSSSIISLRSNTSNSELFPGLADDTPDYLFLITLDEVAGSTQNQEFKCQTCAQIFDTKEELLAHLSRMPDKCHVCYRHDDVCHVVKKENYCNTCYLLFQEYESFRKHMESYADRCFICDRHGLPHIQASFST